MGYLRDFGVACIGRRDFRLLWVAWYSMATFSVGCLVVFFSGHETVYMATERGIEINSQSFVARYSIHFA